MKSKLLSVLFIFLVIINPFRLVSQTNCLPPTGLTTANITLTGQRFHGQPQPGPWLTWRNTVRLLLQHQPGLM
jgi:hypothetical protein